MTYGNILCVMGLRRIIRYGYDMVNSQTCKGSQTEPIDVEMRDCLEDMIYDLGQESFSKYMPLCMIHWKVN